MPAIMIDFFFNLEISILVRQLVEVQKSLIHSKFQVLGSYHTIKSTAPLILGRFLDIAENNLSTTFVLELDELLSVSKLLLSGLSEEGGYACQCNIVPIIECGLNEREGGRVKYERGK